MTLGKNSLNCGKNTATLRSSLRTSSAFPANRQEILLLLDQAIPAFWRWLGALTKLFV